MIRNLTWLAIVTISLASPPRSSWAQTKITAIEDDTVLALAFSSDGKRIAGGGFGKEIRIWNEADAKLVRTLSGPERTTRAVAFSPDSKWLAAGGDDRVIRIWDVDTGALLQSWTGHERDIGSIAFSPDGKYLAATSLLTKEQGKLVGGVKLWDLAARKLHYSVKLDGSPLGVTFSPDGKTLAVASGAVQILEASTGALKGSLKVDGRKVNRIAFSADGKTIAGGGGHTVKAPGGGTYLVSEAWLWDTDTGTLRRTFTDLNHWLRAIALSPDGKRLATGSSGPIMRDQLGGGWIPSELKVWDTDTGKELWFRHGAPGHVNSIAMSPRGSTMVSCDGGAVTFCDIETGRSSTILMHSTRRFGK